MDMLQFIDTIISYSLAHKSLFENIKQEAPTANVLSSKYISYETPSASLNITDTEFVLALYKDSNIIAFKKQVYSSSYNVTCFKYGVTVSKKCRLDFPHPYIDKTRVIKLGSIEILQNHLWINSWNLALTSLIKSNYSINFISSNVKVLALVCCIINYVTNRDCNQYQHVIGAAFV